MCLRMSAAIEPFQSMCTKGNAKSPIDENICVLYPLSRFWTIEFSCLIGVLISLFVKGKLIECLYSHQRLWKKIIVCPSKQCLFVCNRNDTFLKGRTRLYVAQAREYTLYKLIWYNAFCTWPLFFYAADWKKNLQTFLHNFKSGRGV